MSQPKKLVFKPTIPSNGNHEGKGKMKAVMAEESNVDIKPSLETLEVEAPDVAVDDLARSDGVLAFKYV